VLIGPPAVREIAARNDELGRSPLDQGLQSFLDSVGVPGPEMEV